MRNIWLTSILIFGSFIVMADSWAPPKTKDYYNEDRTYFVRIVPRTVPEKFWKWMNAKPRQKDRFSPADATIIPCHAIMYKKTKNGDSLVWKKKLINQTAPVSAFVSNNAGYLVTFDNWHSMGYGVDVMVYYDNQGDLIKRHMLEDISPFPINTYSMSVSSIWWRCDTKFLDNNRLEICFKDDKETIIRKTYNLDKKGLE
ncbi:MAG: hypothetical protein KA713_01190 [Chryseotalea sp. WA131a]|nr:MAG: hypothetical protein KA713_01190 [Chryseotalea sp. WA131a]